VEVGKGFVLVFNPLISLLICISLLDLKETSRVYLLSCCSYLLYWLNFVGHESQEFAEET